MKRLYIKYLIGFISFALIGIIAVQLLWINNTISENEQQFHARVYSMLHRVVEKTERNEVALMYRVRPRVTQYNTYSGGHDSDSLFREFQRNSMEQIRLLSQQSPLGGNMKGFIDQVDSMQQWIEHQFIDKTDQIQSVSRWLTFEAEVKRLPLRDRLKLSRFEEILSQEQVNFNIITPIEYAIMEYGVQKPVLGTSGFKTKDKTTYKVELFPNDIMSASPFLYVQFPEKNSFLLHSIQWLLLLSLVFTLVVLIAFYLTVRIIIQQKKVSEVKNDFINNMTHELKTPIATISLATDAMSRSISESSKGFTNIIKQESERMNKHVEQILQMARIDLNEFKIQLELIDLNDFVKDVCDSQQIRVAELQGKLTFTPSNEQISIEVDPDHFTNVLYNLLDNALKYANGIPVIEIKLKRKEKYVYVNVIDNGVGMSKEAMKHVFDKFYRATSGNIHNVKGFGLGLSYVKAVIDKHKGDITVKSELGKGSVFTIKLPMAVEKY